MTLYRVTWDIDVIADTAEEAARWALRIQRDPQSIATVFDVEGDDGTVTIDLDTADQPWPTYAARERDWRPASNGAGRRHWFLIRDQSVPLAERYLEDARGRLVRFSSMEAAQRRADKLNQKA